MIGYTDAQSAVRRTATGSTALTLNDDVVFINVSAADVPVVTLPAASSRLGRPYTVWNIGPAAVKVSPTATDNINGGNVSEYISTFATARVYSSDGTQWWSQLPNFQSVDPRKGGYLYEDFQVAQGTLAAANGVGGSTNLEIVMSGANTATTGGAIGSFLTMSTGSTTTGRVSVHSAVATGFMNTGGLYVLQMGFLSDPNLSSAGENYAIYAGFGDNDGSGDMVDGVYFGYNHAVNSGKWTGNTAAASSRTQLTGGTTTTFAISTYYDMRICVDNRTGTPVAYFWVNDVYQGQLTTNIPTSVSNAFAHFFTKIEKAAGTTARTWSPDYFTYNSTVVTTAR